MKTTSSKTLRWIQKIVIVSFLSLLFTPQLFAQRHHFPPFPSWHDSADVDHRWHDSLKTWHDSLPDWRDTSHSGGGHHMGGGGWLDSLRHAWDDSLDKWLDSLHQWRDSGFTWHDTGHFPFPPPPDSGNGGQDTGIWGHGGFPPPPPPDSGWGHGGFPPPPPPDSGWTWHDSGHTGCDSGMFPPPPPPDSGFWGHHHRLAGPDNSSAVVSVSIYPNPVSESATLHIENTSGNITLRMYDSNGRLAMMRSLTNGDFQISKETIGTGVYIYDIRDGDTSISKGRLIIQ